MANHGHPEGSKFLSLTGRNTNSHKTLQIKNFLSHVGSFEDVDSFQPHVPMSHHLPGLVKKLKGTGLEADLPMLRVPEKVTNIGILMITGQRGLCGPYNAFVIKKVQARLKVVG